MSSSEHLKLHGFNTRYNAALYSYTSTTMPAQIKRDLTKMLANLSLNGLNIYDFIV